jgi:hypothetical protein
MREAQLEDDLGLTGDDRTDLHTAMWPKNRLSSNIQPPFRSGTKC